MAKYLDFKHQPEPPDVLLKKKVESAPLDNAEALLKSYALLSAAEQRGLLDVLRGAIEAEDTIIDKVAGYANTPEGINTMRNLLVLGKLLGSLNPDVLKGGVNELTAGVVAESAKKPSGIFALTRRLFSRDALKGLGLAVAALEGVGRAAKSQGRR